ncbi:DUF2460 domain-containing protein [bacterium]|nr:DUF2460 domain-containing protein [bacterium]
MATLDQLRLKILDKKQVVLGERIGTGDAGNKVFKLRLNPVISGSVTVYVDGSEVTEGVDFTLDYNTGKLTFTTAPPDGDSVTADYGFAAFSDSDLQEFLDAAGGNLALAAGDALTSLLADRNRLVTWSKGDAKIDYDKLRKDIAEVAVKFHNQGVSEAGGAVSDDVDWEEVV